MKDGRVTADTLAKIVKQVAEANAQSPKAGAVLFEESLRQIKLLRASALDQATD